MLSPTKELIKKELLKLLSFFKEKNYIQNYSIQNNVILILINADKKIKEEIAEEFMDIAIKKLYPYYKRKEILNLPLLHSQIIENGIKIEF
jgi:hypothetical protein